MALRRILILAAASAALASSLGVAAAYSRDDPRGGALDPIAARGEGFVPKPAGTTEDLSFYYGPYVIPPGHDMNRFDLNLPVRNGFVLALEPALRRADDLTEPVHQEAHIHHAHWLRLDPGNEQDNYTYGMTRWLFGTGDEETAADARKQTNADPKGPVYGGFAGPGNVEPLVYMIHNKTTKPLNVYLVLDVTFLHGTKAQLEKLTGRPHRDMTNVLFGRTFDVPRQAGGNGVWETARDDPRGVIEWTSTLDGTIIGAGAHLHPGGIGVTLENYGSGERPCPGTKGGYGGTAIFKSEAIFRNALYSEDFQMTITRPEWRAPIRKGDRLRISGTYENRDHAWYAVMTHTGFAVDRLQPPRQGCAAYAVGPAAERKARPGRAGKRRRAGGGKRSRARARNAPRRRSKPKRDERRGLVYGVPNRPWQGKPEPFCGERFGGPACERPEPDRGPGYQVSQVAISGFLYTPGDRSLAGKAGAPVQVKKGTSLSFVNYDIAANIRHSVTTCAWPCNGRYVANYPSPDGAWDSETLGYDLVDGGSPLPAASTPKDLPAGKYSYFCRIHPWMRGAFEVVG